MISIPLQVGISVRVRVAPDALSPVKKKKQDQTRAQLNATSCRLKSTQAKLYVHTDRQSLLSR